MHRIGVVGSGIMGAGIAEVAARAGFDVVLRSRTDEGAAGSIAALERSLARKVERGTCTESERDDTLERVDAVTDLTALSDAAIVIESIIEDLPTKQALFAELDAICPPNAIIATNTSTLPIVDLAARTTRPDRVCGIHFFNPAPAMRMVEIARAITTSDATIDAAVAFAAACGKETVIVPDRAGFLVNALLFPYLNHAVKLFAGGVASAADIDRAMKGACNFPMGPLELLDLVGLDTSLAILEAIYASSHEPGDAPAPLLRQMVTAGRLGRKSGVGFHDYSA